jgi:hypothetical protein
VLFLQQPIRDTRSSSRAAFAVLARSRAERYGARAKRRREAPPARMESQDAVRRNRPACFFNARMRGRTTARKSLTARGARRAMHSCTRVAHDARTSRSSRTLASDRPCDSLRRVPRAPLFGRRLAESFDDSRTVNPARFQVSLGGEGQPRPGLAASDSIQDARSIVVPSFRDFRLGVHHERPALDDGLVQRPARGDDEPCALTGRADTDAVTRGEHG